MRGLTQHVYSWDENPEGSSVIQSSQLHAELCQNRFPSEEQRILELGAFQSNKIKQGVFSDNTESLEVKGHMGRICLVTRPEGNAGEFLS